MKTAPDEKNHSPKRNPRRSLPLAVENLDNADRVRRFDCRSYNPCVVMAARRDWPGFTCRKCDAYEPPPAEEKAWDAKCCLRLAARVLFTTELDDLRDARRREREICEGAPRRREEETEMRNEEIETEGTEEAQTYPLAWSAQGEPMDVPDEAVAWRVRRHKIGAQGGAPEVVWSQGKPLVLALEATLEELIERVDGKPGRYRLDPIEDTGKPIKSAPSAYAVIEKQIDLVPVEEPVAPAPRVDPVLALLERKEQQIEHLTNKLTEIASALAAQQAPMMAANAAMLVPPGRPIEVQMPAMPVQAEAKGFDVPAFFNGLLQALPMLAGFFPKLLPPAPTGGTPTGGAP